LNLRQQLMTLFYKLTTDKANQLLNANLPRSSWELWTWLTTLDPFGNQTIPLSWEKAHEAIGISKTTFYRALKTLINSGLLISRKIAHFCVSFKNGTQDPEEKIESQKSSSEFQNCDPSLYIDLEINQILSEGESQENAENAPEPASKTVAPNSPTTAEVIQNASANPISQREEKFSAADCTKKHTKGFNWLPEGPWNLNNKLDPNFRDWLAKDWQGLYGGTIHQKRADVLSHFKKDPANLAIRWEQYQSEFLNRVQNTQILLSQGVAIKPETQDKLLANHRALTAELPAELNPIANQTIAAEVTEVAALPGPTPEAEATAPAHAEGQEPEAETPSKSSALPQTPSKNFVTNQEGQRLKVFQRPEVAEEDRDPSKLREMLQGFLKGFGKSRSTPVQHQPVTENLEQAINREQKAKQQAYLDELNAWIADPLLRDEAVKKVFASESYKCLFDEDGTPYQVVYCEEF